MEKEYIMSHVDDLKAEQLVDFINKGIVTLDELRNTGDLDASKARQILAIINKVAQEHAISWNNAIQTNTITGFENYLNDYPNGVNVSEAKNKIAILREDQEWSAAKQNNTKSAYEKYIQNYPNGNYISEANSKIHQIVNAEKIVSDICENPNKYAATQIRQYLSNGLLTRDQLEKKNIPSDVIDKLLTTSYQPSYEIGATPTEIPNGFTEVYFWGLSSSGKTTALAGIFSTAYEKGWIQLAKSNGFKYMSQLQTVFNDKIAVLPRGNQLDETQYLPFELRFDGEKNSRSISLIELSGETVECFYYKMKNEALPTEMHEKSFDLLDKFLKSKNRKIHFFFVDYESQNQADGKGVTQSQYLDAAAGYFSLPENNYFENSTDSIYIVLTKSDLMPGDVKTEIIKSYLEKNRYKTLVNSLKSKCQKHHINNGKLLATHYTLGEVYFKNYCVFNNETSLNLIDILKRRVSKSQNSILNAFNK